MQLPNFRMPITRMRRLLVDVALSGSAFFVVAILPYLQQKGGVRAISDLLPSLATYAVIAAIALFVTRTYQMIWRYMGFRDLLRLIFAATLTLAGFLTYEILLVAPNFSVPGTLLAWVVILVWTANIGFLAAPRLLLRAIDELTHNNNHADQARYSGEHVLLTGDTTRMNTFIRECASDPNSRYRVAGVLTDNPRLRGSYLQGVRVFDEMDRLDIVMADLARQGLRPQMLVVAKDSSPADTDFNRYLELSNAANIKLGRLPPTGTLAEGLPVKTIELSDLLGRPEIKIDMQAVASMIQGKCVLVTGAGGSIGSELCRQIAHLKPSRLVVLDASEFNLYSIDAELAENHPNLKRETALVDVRDTSLISHWIGRANPAMVFHAAALKHVPLIEDHPIEGIKTNVFGTINVAEACRAHRIPTMVTISTDKAVNPTNIMGATKRLAEAYCQGLDLAGDAIATTRFIMVRFGNVLGSTGSVVPLFRRQIEAGGPVTVTHPDITRYFMTIPEAVSLVMMAGAQGMEVQNERGNIYLLDMGEPVKIMDLARQMIRLSRRRSDRDVRIEIVGLRPGEKLYEELSHMEEAVQQTRSKSILRLAPRATDLRIIRQQVQELRQACVNNDLERALRLLKISVPDYVSSPDNAASVL